MNYAKEAALRLDRQRISLQRQHKSLLADLAKTTSQAPAAEFSERIEGLRLALRQSMIENTETSRTLVERMTVLNFGSMGEASQCRPATTGLASLLSA